MRWSRASRTSPQATSTSPRSVTNPVAASGSPASATSTWKEWPWMPRYRWPSGKLSKWWAASKPKRYETSIGLADTDDLVRLQGQPPTRMREAVVDRLARVGLARGTVHRLQEEVVEGESLEALGRRLGLREHELQLVAGGHLERGIRLWAHAHPVDARGRRDGAVGLDRHAE